MNYTWSKAIDDVRARNELGGNAGDNAFGNQYDRAADRGLSGNDIAHRLVSNVNWVIPGPKNRGTLRQLVGGWNTGLLFEARSGAPFGVIENNGAAIVSDRGGRPLQRNRTLPGERELAGECFD